MLPEIAEWDYGRAEGRTRQDVSAAGGFAWDVWRDGPRSLPESLEGDWVETLPNGEQVPVHNGPGETVEEAAARTREAIATVKPLLDAGNDVLLVHFLPGYFFRASAVSSLRKSLTKTGYGLRKAVGGQSGNSD